VPNLLACLKGHFVGVSNKAFQPTSWHQFRTLVEQAEDEEPTPQLSFSTKCGSAAIGETIKRRDGQVGLLRLAEVLDGQPQEARVEGHF
jgi:hypothetical protein